MIKYILLGLLMGCSVEFAAESKPMKPRERGPETCLQAIRAFATANETPVLNSTCEYGKRRSVCECFFTVEIGEDIKSFELEISR